MAAGVFFWEIEERKSMHDQETATRHLSLPLEIKADGETGSFEGYGAIFGNRDRDGDIVARGAFARSLKGGLPALLWQHDQKAPIGRFDEVREDDKGLFVRGKLAMHGRGLEAYELLKMGALNGLSIGFVTKEASRDPATRTRTITEADLMEISLVTFPANELARVNTVKAARCDQEETDMADSLNHTARSFERLLRNNGFSRRDAKMITAKGFKAADFSADESAEIAEIVRELKQRQQNLKPEETKNVLDSLGKFFGFASAINSVSLFPGEEHDDIAILPVAPGKVQFSVKAPRGVKFECYVRYYKFVNGRAIREEVKLTHDRPARRVDRGIRKNLLPPTDLHEIYSYLSRLPRNVVIGSTRARLKHLPYDEEDPRRERRDRVKFILSAKGE